MIPANYKNRADFTRFVGQLKAQDSRVVAIEQRLECDAVKSAIAAGDFIGAALYTVGLTRNVRGGYKLGDISEMVRSRATPLDGPGLLVGSDGDNNICAVGITRASTQKGCAVQLFTPTYDAEPRAVSRASPLPRILEVPGDSALSQTPLSWTNYRVVLQR